MNKLIILTITILSVKVLATEVSVCNGCGVSNEQRSCVLKNYSTKAKVITKEVKTLVPVEVEKVVTKEVEVRSDNLISLELVQSQNGLDASSTTTSTKVEVKEQLGLGLLYQRRIDNIYLGLGLDTNSGKRISVGTSF